MRLGSLLHPGAGRLCALLDEETILDVGAVDRALPSTMDDVLADPDAALPRLAAVLAKAPASARRRLTDTRLGPPVGRPGKVIGIGLNYRDHAEETGQALPDYPTVFAKFPTSVTGPEQPIRLPAGSDKVDYEGELGVVIGRTVRGATATQALAAVAGYLVVNDVSARDVQHRTSQWTLGKSFDTFAPTGPFLVTADEVSDPQDLALSVLLNGVPMQASNTKHMLFGVAELVALLSEVATLEPGDLIATGTPAGIGAAQNPPRFLRDGDLVEVDIAGLGRLRNPVVADRMLGR